MGTSTTWRIDRNIAANDTGSRRSQQPDQRRRDQRGEQGGHRGDRHRQGDIATGQPGHHVGSGAAGAAADQDHAHRDLRRQLQQAAEQPGQAGHDDELGQHADQHPYGGPGDLAEVFALERQAHAEHHQAEQWRDGCGEREEPGRSEEGEDGEQQDPEREAGADEAAQGGQARMGFPCYWTAASLPCGRDSPSGGRRRESGASDALGISSPPRASKSAGRNSAKVSIIRVKLASSWPRASSPPSFPPAPAAGLRSAGA